MLKDEINIYIYIFKKFTKEKTNQKNKDKT
jgi:hypothetical protein